jgi:hypothetical protein
LFPPIASNTGGQRNILEGIDARTIQRKLEFHAIECQPGGRHLSRQRVALVVETAQRLCIVVAGSSSAVP